MTVPPTWTFARSDQRVVLLRREREDGVELVVQMPDEPARIYAFSSLVSLVSFQSDMEYLLVHTGWSLVAFAPDRRSYGDRRTFPRETNDRRRWWTDGAASAKTLEHARPKRDRS
jgi:hypothetical protein